MKKNLAIIVSLLCWAGAVFASTSDGTIDSVSKYAWADSGGWVNFGNSQGNVHVTDTAITGNAWVDNYGWIKLDATQSGVTNDGEGNLAGSAWGANMGWVDFENVTINSSGQFTGTASTDSIGEINFDCAHCQVITDWRPASVRNVSVTPGPSGGYSSSSSSSSTDSTIGISGGGFTLLINNGSSVTNSSLVTLQFTGGGSAFWVDISNDESFQYASHRPYAQEEPWVLLQGDGERRVFVRFQDEVGRFSPVISASITVNTHRPDIFVGKLPDFFWSDETVSISGTTDPDAQLIFSFNGHYGIEQSDGQGNWTADLGKLSAGTYPLDISVKNQAGNSRSARITIISRDRIFEPNLPEEKKPWSLLDSIKQRIDRVLGNQQPGGSAPSLMVTIPQTPPLVFTQNWKLLHIKIIR